MAATDTEEQEVDAGVFVVAPFGIEINTPRNSDVLLQGIPGTKLRTAIDGSKSGRNFRTGEAVVPVDQAIGLASFPKTPGQWLLVNPAELTYMIKDPMHGDATLCNRVQKWMNSSTGTRIEEKLDGIPPQKGTLDKHRMKTLCREMFWLLDAGDANICRGAEPKMEEIDELPGDYLTNPGSQVATGQPYFEKDLEGWADKLRAAGG